METFKVIRDFSTSRYTDLELSVKATHVVAQMTGNESFPAPNPPLEDITEANASYIVALHRVEGGSREDTVIKNNRRKIVDSLLTLETEYVQRVSEGNEAIILSSGFDVNKKHAVIGSLPKVTGLRLKPGDNKGTIMAGCDVLSHARFYEFEYTDAPNTAASIWIKRTTTKHRLLIEGLTSGRQYVFRVAGAGSDPSRNWSDEISSFVL